MACAVFADRDPCVGGSYFDIEVRISDGVADLLESAACRKHRKCAGEGYHSGRGKACSDSHHIALRDAAVNMSVRKCFFEDARLGSACQIRIQNDKIVMLSSKLDQSVPVTLSCCDLLYFRHNVSSTFLSSSIAAAYCSSLGALPCQPTWFSMYETPLPLTVFIMIAVGIPLNCRASLKAASS